MRSRAVDGRAAGGWALDEEQLCGLGIVDLAVGQTTGEGVALEGTLATCQVSRLARCLAGSSCCDRLVDDLARLRGILLEELREPLVHGLLDETFDPGVAELRLRLPFELWLGQLHGDDGRESLADVLALEVVLLLLQQALVARVLVERRRQGAPEAGQMRAALLRVDVVREREDRLDVRAVPLHRDLDSARRLYVAVRLALEVDDGLVQRILRLVHVCHEVLDPTLVVELDVLSARPFVGEDDAEALREERGLAEALDEHVLLPLDLVEHLVVRHEDDRGTRLLRRADGLEVGRRLAAGELLLPDLAVAADLDGEPLGQRVHDRDADAVQPSRDLVALAAELPAGVQLRQNDRDGGQSLIRHDVHRNA